MSLTVNSVTSATAILNIDPAAATGARTITLTTGSEIDTLSNAFTVTAGTPVLLSVHSEQRPGGATEFVGRARGPTHKLGAGNDYSELRGGNHRGIAHRELPG